MNRTQRGAVPPDPHLITNATAANTQVRDGERAGGEPWDAELTNKGQETGSSECNELGLRETLCEAMATIHQRGWCDGTGGNFSCVLERQPLQLLMAPSGVDKGRVRPQELIVVDGKGGVCRGSGRASAETLLHLAIVNQTGAGAVLHTHSQAGTLLSQWCWEQPRRSPQDAEAIRPGTENLEQPERTPEHQPMDKSSLTLNEALGCEEADGGDGVAFLEVSNLEMLKGIAGITTHQSMVRIPVLANDQDLNRLSRRAGPHLSKAPAGILIAGHGLYAWGRELNEARRHLEILEFLLEQRWRQLLLEALLGNRPISSSKHDGNGGLR